uniref:Protein phosphatase 1H-like n=1 Tax=Gouania willdenowi TaxID=441366 RepID=A0A8C5EJY6_GOUWI
MSHDRREACVCVCACLFPCSLSPAPLLPLTPLIRTAVRAPSQTHTPLLDRSTMLTRVRSVVSSFMGGVMAGGSNGEPTGGSDLPHRFLYSRPEFLGLSPDEIECSADHGARPILILKENRRLPWCSGYAEAYKTVEEDDLKFPLIYGEGKKARVLATIGVTRGLGDHNLKVHDSKIYIKPFLSCCPEVRVYPLEQCKHSADDVLVLGTDGLWDVLSNQEVAEVVNGFLANCDADDQHRYTMAAQELVMRARGVLKDRGWRITNDRLGSGDDISVFIVPLMYGNKLNSLST